jgi:hypothetical protein
MYMHPLPCISEQRQCACKHDIWSSSGSFSESDRASLIRFCFCASFAVSALYIGMNIILQLQLLKSILMIVLFSHEA